MEPLQPSLDLKWQAFVNELDPRSMHEIDEARFADFVRTARHPARRKTPIHFGSLVATRWPGLEDDDVHEVATRLEDWYRFGLLLLSGRLSHLPPD